jgi:hypothetical protein
LAKSSIDDRHFPWMIATLATNKKIRQKKKKPAARLLWQQIFCLELQRVHLQCAYWVQYAPRAPCFRRIFEKDFVKFELGAHIFIINISFGNGSGVCAVFFEISRCSKFRPQTTTTNNQNHNNFVFFPSERK